MFVGFDFDHDGHALAADRVEQGVGVRVQCQCGSVAFGVDVDADES